MRGLTRSLPAARKYFKLWTRSQALKALLSLILCVALVVLFVIAVGQLIPKNVAGQAQPSAVAGATLAMLGSVLLVALLALRYCVRFLPAPPNTPKPPKLLNQFGIADIVCLVIVAAGVGIILAMRWG